MKEAGLASAFFAVFVSQGPRNPEGQAGAKAKVIGQRGFPGPDVREPRSVVRHVLDLKPFEPHRI